jgi:hypothetical protein
MAFFTFNVFNGNKNTPNNKRLNITGIGAF